MSNVSDSDVGGGSDLEVGADLLQDSDVGGGVSAESVVAAPLETDAGSAVDGGETEIPVLSASDDESAAGVDAGLSGPIEAEVASGDDEPVTIFSGQVDWVIGEVPIDVFGVVQVYPIPIVAADLYAVGALAPVTVGSSSDGDTWRTSNPLGPQGTINALAADGLLVVAVGYSADYLHTVAVSRDGGSTWAYPAVDPFVDPAAPNQADALVALIHNGVIYIGGEPSNPTIPPLAKSTDNGQTWQSCPATQTTSTGLKHVNLIAAEGNLIVAAGNNFLHGTTYTETGYTNPQGPILVLSTDGGVTWSYVDWTASIGGWNRPTGLAVHSGTIYLGTDTTGSLPLVNFAFSSDHGATWTSSAPSDRSDILAESIQAFVFLPDGSILLGGSGTSLHPGAMAIYNSGTWTTVGDAVFVVPGYNYPAVTQFVQDGGTIYAVGNNDVTTANVFLAKSTDNGLTWTGIAPIDYSTVNSAEEFYVYGFALLGSTLVVVGQDSSNLLTYATSTDGGATWQFHPGDPFANGILYEIAVGTSPGGAGNPPAGPYIVVGAGSYSTSPATVSRTQDLVDWVTEQPMGSTATLNGIDAVGDLVVVAGSTPDQLHSLAVSTDGGQHWTMPSPDPFAPNPAGGDTGGGQTVLIQDGVIFVGAQWSSTQWLAISRDNGQTWTTVDVGVNINGVVGIAKEGQLVVVTGENETPTPAETMIAVSTDGGNTFTQHRGILAGYQAVAPVVKNGVIYVGSISASGGPNFAISTDQGTTWETTSEADRAGACPDWVSDVLVLDDGTVFIGGGGGDWTVNSGVAMRSPGGVWSVPLSVSLFPNSTYALFEFGGAVYAAGGNTVAKSMDGGQTWTFLDTGHFSSGGSGGSTAPPPVVAWGSTLVAVGYDTDTGHTIQTSTDGVAFTEITYDPFLGGSVSFATVAAPI